jgi:uncharacterized protein (DUF1499 family)
MTNVEALFTAVVGVLAVGGAGTGTAQAAAGEGRLAPCASSPNCVSSQATDDKHRIEPLRYTVSRAEAMAIVARAIAAMPRTRIVKQTDTYLHAEFTTAVLRFVDDVEFVVNDDAKLVHVRSASRVGYSDLGVNRRRVEAIRERVAAQLAPQQDPATKQP